jgi:oxygen-independent coproporphyrinogen-3 oxidase
VIKKTSGYTKNDTSSVSIQTPLFDAELIQRYDGNGPRYTSYPTAAQFSAAFTAGDYIAAAKKTNELLIPAPLSLYVHIPFCDTVCYYCACNKVITKNRAHAKKYVDYLVREIAWHADLYDRDRKVVQLHFGGGTPTFLSIPQFDQLVQTFETHFSLVKDTQRDFSIELDPRAVDKEYVFHLGKLGFNRFSLGVQDLDKNVQRAVNRIQSFGQTLNIINACRTAGADSVNIDLIYGLPEQTHISFGNTLDTVIDKFRPDRLSIFNYAHLPERFKTQRQIDADLLPTSEDKLCILETAINTLSAAGYIHIGMDHFALPSDSLVKAFNEKTLQRNFQGYSTHGGCDLVSMGVSAIGKPGRNFYQNTKLLEDYYALIDDSKLPIDRGLKMSAEDRIRSEIIQQLSCYHELRTVEFGVDFKHKFAWEIAQLEKFVQDGLIENHTDVWRVTAKGRLLIRNICAVFDRYQHPSTSTGFSRLI